MPRGWYTVPPPVWKGFKVHGKQLLNNQSAINSIIGIKATDELNIEKLHS